MKPNELDGFLLSQFQRAGAEGGVRLHAHQFGAYYATVATCQSRTLLRSALGVEAESERSSLLIESFCLASLCSPAVHAALGAEHRGPN